jgi:hypothetical protein
MESTEEEDNPVFPIDLSIFKEQIEQNLLNILDSMPKQEKTLIIEKSLISKLSFFTKLEPLRKRQVHEKLSTFSKEPPIQKTPILLYMIPSNVDLLEIIQSPIKDNVKKTLPMPLPKNNINNKNEEIKEEEIKKDFHIIFVPKITNECNNFIKNSEFPERYHVYNFNMDIFPLDYDLMSLEDYTSFYDLYVEQNLNCISILTRAIIKYESIFGKIKHRYYKGFLAEKLNKTLLREEEISSSIDKNNDPGTFCCFIFDRVVDMITPFCTQFVYEGLIDDYFGINFNSIKVNPKVLEKQSQIDFIKLDLSRNEKFYTKIKDYNFIEVKSFLPRRLKEHNKILEDSKNLKMDLDNLQDNITKMKDVKDERPSLINHINLADYISKKQKLPKEKLYLNIEQTLLIGDTPSTFYEFIQDELAKKSEIYNLLRIICLESIINGGIKNKIFEQLRKDIINIYGFQEIFLLRNLEKMNILRNNDGSNNFYNILNKNLKLINESVDIYKPNDSSYVYSGYCPIFIRLIEKALTKGWNSIKDVLNKTPGDFDYPKDEKLIIDNNSKDKKFILLIFIGGITYGELAAIRYLNQNLGDKKFIILTTSIINNKKIFNSLRQGKYSYTLSDENSINSVDSNTFEINSEKRFTFKDFAEQSDK